MKVAGKVFNHIFLFLQRAVVNGNERTGFRVVTGRNRDKDYEGSQYRNLLQTENKRESDCAEHINHSET